MHPDSERLIKLHDVLMTEPLKAAPKERDLVIDMPEHYKNLNEWEPEFSWN